MGFTAKTATDPRLTPNQPTQRATPAAATTTATAPINQVARLACDRAWGILDLVDDGAAGLSRFNRFKSARISAACWYRMSGFFSRALLIMRSNSSGRSRRIALAGR